MLGPSQSLPPAVLHISVFVYRELFFSSGFVFFKAYGSKIGKANWPQSECLISALIGPLGKVWYTMLPYYLKHLVFLRLSQDFAKLPCSHRYVSFL